MTKTFKSNGITLVRLGDMEVGTFFRLQPAGATYENTHPPKNKYFGNRWCKEVKTGVEQAIKVSSKVMEVDYP